MTVLVSSRNLFGFSYLILLCFTGIANGNYWRTLSRQGANPSGDMCADDEIVCKKPTSCSSLSNSRENCKVLTGYCKWACGTCLDIDEEPDCPEFRGCYYYSYSQSECEDRRGQGCTWACGRCIEEPLNDIAGCYKMCDYCACMENEEGCITTDANTPCRESKIDYLIKTETEKVPRCEISYDELPECERLTGKYILYDGAICFVPGETHEDCPEPNLVKAINLNGKSHTGPDNILYEAEDRSNGKRQGVPEHTKATTFRLVDNVEVEVTDEDATLYKTWVKLHEPADKTCLNYEVSDIVPGARYELVMSFIEESFGGRKRIFILKIGKLTLPIKIENYPFQGSRFVNYVYEIRVVFFIRKGNNDRTFLDAVGSEYMFSVPNEVGPITISLCRGVKTCYLFDTNFNLAAFYVQRF